MLGFSARDFEIPSRSHPADNKGTPDLDTNELSHDGQRLRYVDLILSRDDSDSRSQSYMFTISSQCLWDRLFPFSPQPFDGVSYLRGKSVPPGNSSSERQGN
jgi:hypothetical protein